MNEHDDEAAKPGADPAAGSEEGHSAGKGRESAGDPEEQLAGAGREASGVPDAPPDAPVAFPRQTPLFHAQHADRYARQDLIKRYEQRFGCRLIVMIDVIFPESVTFLEELLFDADPGEDLHMVLDSPGGDGETAVRLVRFRSGSVP